jgi:serine/threonine-protein kinase
MAAPPQEPSSEKFIAIGDVLAGKYRVERLLGRGGMGMVLSAIHVKLDERVAIKLLLPEALAEPEAVARFEREARAVRKIKSEHVAKVSDVDTLEDGSPYIVMEYLDGLDLGHFVKRRGPLPISEAVDYMLQVCEVLAEAHSYGIVHRDLKPANLFVTTRADGSTCIKVIDFGISKVLHAGQTEAQGGLTATGMILGSPLFMSPEQMIAPKTVDGRADIWSVGATLYKLLTGRPPFDGESMPQVCAMILAGAWTPIAGRRPDTPPGLEEVVRRCLQREPNDRYANVAQLAAALAVYGGPQAQASAERAARVLAQASPKSARSADTAQPSGPVVATGVTPAPTISSTSLPIASAPPAVVPPAPLSDSGARGAATLREAGGSLVTPPPSVERTNVAWGASPAGAPAPAPVRWPVYAGALMFVLGIGIAVGMWSRSGAAGTAPAEALPIHAVQPPSVSAPAEAAPPAVLPVGALPTSSASAAPTAAPTASASAAPSGAGKAKLRAPGGGTTGAGTPSGGKKKGGDLFDDRN